MIEIAGGRERAQGAAGLLSVCSVYLTLSGPWCHHLEAGLTALV